MAGRPLLCATRGHACEVQAAVGQSGSIAFLLGAGKLRASLETQSAQDSRKSQQPEILPER